MNGFLIWCGNHRSSFARIASKTESGKKCEATCASQDVPQIALKKVDAPSPWRHAHVPSVPLRLRRPFGRLRDQVLLLRHGALRERVVVRRLPARRAAQERGCRDGGSLDINHSDHNTIVRPTSWSTKLHVLALLRYIQNLLSNKKQPETVAGHSL